MNQYEMKKLAYQSNLRNRALQVLLYLIDRANKEQTCFPAVRTIARELHISVSTVKRAMQELVETGYVAKESRFREGNGGQTSNLYTLFFPENRENAEGKECLSEKCEPQDEAGCEKREKKEQLQIGQLKRNGEETADRRAKYTNANCAEQGNSVVTGGGGHSDTTLNIQYNQKLKSEKEVYRFMKNCMKLQIGYKSYGNRYVNVILGILHRLKIFSWIIKTEQNKLAYRVFFKTKRKDMINVN